MNTIYLSDNQIVMNYNRMYPKNRDTLLKSDTFRFVLEYFMDAPKARESKKSKRFF